MDVMEKAKTSLVLEYPFWSVLAHKLPLIETTSLPHRAATDGDKVYYNPELNKDLNRMQAMGLYAHELCHVMQFHTLRQGGREPMKWNIACDHVINLVLLAEGFQLPPGGLHDEQYKDMSEEEVYAKLPKDAGKGGAGGNFDGEDLIFKPMSPEQRDAVREKVVEAVAAAATIAKMAGKMSGALERMVHGLLYPEVPWGDVLRRYMKTAASVKETWHRRNPRVQGVYLPGTLPKERMGQVVVIGDTSGSIGQDEMDRMCAEIGGIIDECSPTLTRVLWWDTHLAHEDVLYGGEPLVIKPKGGGGTDMAAALDYVADTYSDAAVVILITDGETPWPNNEPDYPLITVCTTKAHVPFGDVVRV